MRAGFHIFKCDNDDDDNGDTEKRVDLKSRLKKGKEKSRMSVIVLSQNYVSSEKRLDELVMILEQKRNFGHIVLPVFFDVDPSDVRKQKASFGEEYFRILNGEEERIHKAKDIISWFQDRSTNVGLYVICGIGGIGKTTIAKYAYNSFARSFEGRSFLANTNETAKQFDQIDAILGMRDWLNLASKIIITTRHESLLKPSAPHKVSAVSSRRPEIWGSALEKLETIPDDHVIEKLKLSFDSLEEDHDKDIFLHIAFFFLGMDRDDSVRRLDGCGFHTIIGMQNLIDRSLLTISDLNKLEMHQLLRDIGRNIRNH
ncbi:hypothetical protein BC332_22141 [Capsicum chinense]|nr:hypothetical protein BC332_22141 [Capsicum chinense]